MSSDRQQMRDELIETLRTVACCDYRVGVGELGLVEHVAVDDDGVARVEVLPCCTYGMARLEHEVRKEAGTVGGVTGVEVNVAWDEMWGPARMADSVDEATPDIEELAEAHGVEPRGKKYVSEDAAGE